MRTTLIACMACLSGAWSGAALTETSFVVEVDAAKPRVASVTARLAPDERGFCMTRSQRDTGLTHGWATFVHALDVQDSAGRAIGATYDGAGCWRVQGDGPFTVRYDVLLQHDRFPNEPGDDELAYAGDWGQFWTGRALFLEGRTTGPIDVELRLPENWIATTPWAPGKGAGRFRAADADALLDSGLMLGLHRSRQLQRAGASIGIGLAGEGPQQREAEIVDLLASALDGFAALHQEEAGGSLAVFLAQGRLLGGGVVGRTISMLVEDEVPDALMPTLAYMVMHEVFHLWNARLNYANLHELYWFTEGFAEYFAFQLLRASGHWDEQMLQSQFASRTDLYRNSTGTLSLQDAGRHKLENYDLVYSGGLLAAAELDRLIREQTGGRRRLQDALPLLMRRHRSGSGKPLDPAALIVAIRDSTDVDATEFFSRHITGREPLPDHSPGG